MNTSTLTRAQLTQLIELGQPLALPSAHELAATVNPVPQQTVDPDWLLILTAEVVGWPLASVKVLAQEGRFLNVEYVPIGIRDPDILIVLETGPEAAAFHRAMQAFQNMRRKRTPSLGEWFKEAKPCLKHLVPPLWMLQPSQVEARFVVKWALLTVAKGRRVFDGIDHSSTFDALSDAVYWK